MGTAIEARSCCEGGEEGAEIVGGLRDGRELASREVPLSASVVLNLMDGRYVRSGSEESSRSK